MRNKKSHQLIDRIVGFFKSNSRQILEIVILLVAFALPNCLNFSRIIIEMIEKPASLNDSIIYHLAVKYGNGLIAVLFALLVLIKLRKSNKDCLMNTVKSYHDYSYGWYWFCAKILGIKQCNLAYVPIHMQFKLRLICLNMVIGANYVKDERLVRTEVWKVIGLIPGWERSPRKLYVGMQMRLWKHKNR